MIKFGQTLLIAVLLLIGLAGCGPLKADIPHHIITAAVERQAQQEQTSLWQQLSADATAAPQLSVRRVKVKQVRQVKVANDIAYEVMGTYRYKLRYPQRSPLKQSQVPFSVILQAATDTQPWQLLELAGPTDAAPAWQWRSLNDESA
jgi:predicted small lipoprotein YifL